MHCAPKVSVPIPRIQLELFEDLLIFQNFNLKRIGMHNAHGVGSTILQKRTLLSSFFIKKTKKTERTIYYLVVR